MGRGMLPRTSTAPRRGEGENMRTSPATVFVVAAALFAAHAASAQPNASQRAFTPARQAIDAAIAAHGGLEALRAIKDVQRTGNATAYNQGQSLRPGTPYTTRTVAVKSTVDFVKGRSFTEQVTTPAGGIRTPGRAVLRGDDGFTVAVLTNVVSPMSPAALTGNKSALRRDPAALLLTAAGRAETLRDLGDATFDKRKHRVVTFSDADGAQIALYLDAQTHRVSKLETLADNAVLGDTITEVVFSDYRPVNAVQLPFHVVNRVGGEVVQDLQYSEIKANAGVADTLFDQPAGAVTAKLVPGAGTVVATRLADGVFFLEGSSHNSLAVVLADSVLLIEAPLGEERSQAVLTKLAEIAPGKPVKAVVATHYHYDHSGGLRTHIAKGATVYTTAGNKAFLATLASAAHRIKPDSLGRAPATPKIEVVAGKKSLGDAGHPVELYDVGPSPHVDEMLVAYLPKDKIVFVSDLFTIPPQGPIPPGTPANRDFADKLKKLGLDVQTIAPGHGRMGTLKDLQKALDTPAPN
jgi:glyoxylase-like metal-dependent hydrolase (beta-lactamase superfamily II)